MATKKTGKNRASLPAAPDTVTAKRAAEVALMPSANAAAVVAEYGTTFGQQDVSELAAELRTKFELVTNGDMKLCEAMLVGQANALQSIFMNLARKATSQDYINQYDTFLRLALKAQNQCRMTLETLATIKNPPVVFAKQANINQGGNQQVNNGPPAHAATRAEKTKNQQNELLTERARHGETLDSGRTGTAIEANSHLEAMGTIHRPCDGERQGDNRA